MHVSCIEVVGPGIKEVCGTLHFEHFFQSWQYFQVFAILIQSNAFSSKLHYSTVQLKTKEKI